MSFQRTRVKVCCMMTEQDRDLAIGSGADALGFVGPMPSGPGSITDEVSQRLVRGVKPPVASVLLSSESRAEALHAHATRVGASVLQIVRHITPEESASLYDMPRTFGIFQVIHVEDDGVLDLIDTYADHVDAFLLDSGKPGSMTPTLGGTGHVHDWTISRRFVDASPKPVFLAGGLKPDNVSDAIRTVRPFGLDLCSGIRTDGQLDPRKLAAFMTAVRETDRSLSA